MRRQLIILLFIIPFLTASACGIGNLFPEELVINGHNDNGNDGSLSTKIGIKIGDYTFAATLLDNAAANELKARLPLTIHMTELNGNEKYYRFSENLPTTAANPGTINSGDLMLWGSNTLVLFYKTFSTSYSYTRLGRIDDPAGLAGALGSGNVTVIIELQ